MNEKYYDGDKKRHALKTSQAYPFDNIMFKEPPDGENTCKTCRIAKAVAQALVNDTEDDLGAGTDTRKAEMRQVLLLVTKEVINMDEVENEVF